MAFFDYTPHHEIKAETDDMPIVGQGLVLSENNLLDAVQLSHAERDESLLANWLVKFGIKKAEKTALDDGPQMKFSHLRESQFDRERFDRNAYDGYIEALKKGE